MAKQRRPDPDLQYGLCISICNRCRVYISGKFTSRRVNSWENIIVFVYNIIYVVNVRWESNITEEKDIHLFINKKSNTFKHFARFNQSIKTWRSMRLAPILQFICFPRASNICVIFWQKNLTRFYEKEKKNHKAIGKSMVRCTVGRFIDVKIQPGKGGEVNIRYKYKGRGCLLNIKMAIL